MLRAYCAFILTAALGGGDFTEDGLRKAQLLPEATQVIAGRDRILTQGCVTRSLSPRQPGCRFLTQKMLLTETEDRRRGRQRMRRLDGITDSNGHEFAQIPGDAEAQGSLECCSPRGRRELDTTEQLN